VGVTTAVWEFFLKRRTRGWILVAALTHLLFGGTVGKPADATNQYGHGKVENFSAFVETGLLLLTCVWVIYEAVLRLFYRHVEIEPSIAAFLVMLFSMVLDWWRSGALGGLRKSMTARRWSGRAALFDDIWSAGVVVIGLALVMAGRAYHIGWIGRGSDCALVVAGVVVSVSWRLARRTVDALLDAAPVGARSQITEAVSKVEGVLEVDRVRIRRAGNRTLRTWSWGWRAA